MSTEKLKKFYQTAWNLSESFTNTFGNLGDKLQIVLPLVPLVYFLGEHVLFLLFGICPLGLVHVVTYVITYGICMLICVVLKFLFNAKRPNKAISEGNDGVNPDLPLDPGIETNKSFCSGHTMSAVCGGLFCFFMTFGLAPLGYILGLAGWTLGVLTGFSRIVKRAHWTRDVLTSIGVCLVAFFIATFFM